MVNEVNKPPSDNNAALSARLAASTQQLQEMQEEHRQLLREMETLRVRATELTRLNAQRRQLRHTEEATASTTTPVLEAEVATEAEAAAAAPAPAPVVEDNDKHEKTLPVAEEDIEDKEETANYLQEKLNEIANLKAQFKRVQHMVDTTKLIEQHMSSKSTTTTTTTTTESTESPVAAATPQPTTSSQQATPESATAAPVDNAEVLNAMLSMFTDFTSDLRGQAESLREERERIKSIKEDLINRRQGK